MLGAAILGHPVEKRRAVEVDAMAVQATERAVGGHVAALGVAVAVLGVVGADDACPALRVGAGEHHALVRQPRQHVVGAVVGQADGL